jgi:3-dehydroshikimate dehydratase
LFYSAGISWKDRFVRFVLHSYSFRDYSLQEAFRNARRFGWDALELHPVHFDVKNPQDELDRARLLAQQFGVAIAAVDFSGKFIGDAGEVEQSIVETEALIRACSDHGIDLMNGFTGWLVQDPNNWGENGSALASDLHYDRAASALQQLAAVAEGYGITLAIEIHMNTIHDSIASTVRLLERVDRENVVATLDPGNMFAVSSAERDPGALDGLAGRLGHVHLKNCLRAGENYDYSVRLADGHIDLYAWLRKLVEQRYNGAITVEYCGEGDPHVAAEVDLPYVRKALAWISEEAD